MSAQAIQAGEAFIKLNIHSDEFQKGLLNVSKKLDGLGGEIQKFASLTKGSFSELSESLGSAAPLIQLTGASFSALAPGISIVQNLTLAFQKNISQTAILIARQGVLATANQAAAASVQNLTAAARVSASVFAAHPIFWFASVVAAVAAGIGVLTNGFGLFTDKLANNARASEEACKQNDAYRTSAKQSMDALEEFSRREALNAEQKKASKSAWNELQRSAEGLGISLDELGISFDEETGKINASAEAMAEFKEKMRTKELDDVNKTINAQAASLEALEAKLKNGKVGWGRWAGTWLTLGYVDNAEEIQEKINETREKLQENLDRQQTIVDFSAEYKENEAKLQEIYDKEKDEAKNALAVKLDAIHQEMEERRSLLNMLIAEASARSDLSAEEKKKLEERRAALAALGDEEKKRADEAKADNKNQVQNIETDFFAKRAENEENAQWKRALETDPDGSLAAASSNSAAADAAFQNAAAALQNADENTSRDELERLNGEVEKTRKEAEKWYARREECAKRAADIEKQAAEDALEAEKEARDLKASRLQEIQSERERRRLEAERKEEEASWNETKESSPEEARQLANAMKKKAFDEMEAESIKLEEMANAGASKEDYEAQRKKAERLAEDARLWERRAEEASLEPMEEIKESQALTAPSVMKSDSVDAQKKFLELQQNNRNPMEEKFDETIGLLKRVADSTENAEGMMEGV